MTQSNTVSIPTTHTGSLPPLLPEQTRLTELLTARMHGNRVDRMELAELSDMAVDATVKWQLDHGLDIISSGEADRAGFMDSSRFAGWGFGPQMSLFRPADLEDAGLLDWFLTSSGMVPPHMNAGKIKPDTSLIEEETARLLKALGNYGAQPSAAFMPEPSPGILASLGSVYYEDDDEFLADITAALREEYRTIADRGLILQVDAPDLVVDWFTWHPGQSPGQYFTRLRRSIQAINDAIGDIPPEQVRVHICHGNWAGPHDKDIDLPRVIGELYQLRAATLVIALANRRHRWEREIFAEPGYQLPPGMKLAAGVIEPVSQCADHEKTVAADLTEIARIVGPGRVIATTDCGFRTMLGLSQTPYLTGLKVDALVAGARLASARLSAAA